jgi:predicted transcriptional regulator
MTRLPNVRNVSVGMSKNSCRRAVCGPRALPPVPADLMLRPASLAAEGFRLAPQFEAKMVFKRAYFS